jgi:prepilin-type N-terminal cleavage/methylation domain-containing protein
MEKRRAFTLVELMVAIFIFSFMAASMATIYSTAHRHMLQNYRGNAVKSTMILGLRAIQNNLAAATRVDVPALGAQGNVLDFATNVDRLTGCYPVSLAAVAVSPPAWHHFCLGNDTAAPGTQALFYHSANLPASGIPCGQAGSPVWNGVYPVPPGSCGLNMGGQTVIKLSQYVVPLPGQQIFSRRSAERINDSATVRVRLRSFWDASARSLGASQRDVDFSLDTVIAASVSRP